MANRIFWCCAIVVFISCGPSQRGLFGDKKTEHEKYGDRIREAGLEATAMGNSWFTAAQSSLTTPLPVSIPFQEEGYFPAEHPTAAGYVFTARKGVRLNITLSIKPAKSQMFYAELWKQSADSSQPQWLSAADSSLLIDYEVEDDGQYILRLQPQLLETFEYSLVIKVVPSLAFPVIETGKPEMISFWNAPRDRGARSHEGVDIRASFRTPAVAAADGRIQRVTDNRLGGKVVFMRPEGKSYALYYAHLDSQMVTTGQKVKAGDVLGLIGNTGNAKTTVPHLHFGIYAIGGAVDPLPFIDNRPQRLPAIRADKSGISKWMRIKKTGEAVKLIGATGNNYRVLYPSGATTYINSSALGNGAFRIVTADTVKLFDRPSAAAAAKTNIAPNTAMSIIGSYGNYHLAEIRDTLGWIKRLPG